MDEGRPAPDTLSLIHIFSNSLAPGIIGASLEVFKMMKESNALHAKLVENVNYFRDKMTDAGFDIKPTQSAICAVMLYDAKLSQVYACLLYTAMPAAALPKNPLSAPACEAH